LADEHGYLSDKGVKIEVNLTHEEIASFLAANRSTITTYLNELKRRGYIWIEERRLVMVPPEHLQILDGLSQAVLDCDSKAAIRWAQKAVLDEVDPVKALEALVTAIRQIDEAYTRNKLSLPDVVGAAFAMKSAMPIIEEQLQRMKIKILTRGTIVIGTVLGDIHDIGKTMVAMLLTSEGFEVIDLGVNVAAEQFISAVESFKPDILAMSSLMTMTIAQQKKVLDFLVEKGLREQVKVMVGGGAITEEIATQFEADGYDGTAQGAVKLAKRLIS
jgi:methanogenic corrinoid protein MtbC1